MSTTTLPEPDTAEAKARLQRVQEALFHLQRGLAPFVEARMKAKYGERWLHYASRAPGSPPSAALDAYGLVKTLLDRWRELFEEAFARNEKHKARTFASLALDARNATAHLSLPLQDEETLRYLDAIHQLLKLVKAPEEEVRIVRRLYDEQLRAGLKLRTDQAAAAPQAAAVAPPPAQPAVVEPEGGRPDLKPWIEVALPHPDVLQHRFKQSEFAADLAAVAMGRASEAYADPVGFFQMTFLTEGLRRVLRSALERLLGKGGDPVLGLQTAFGGGKTHTLLALWHLARARDPLVLPGLDTIAAEVGAEGWAPARVVTFVGTAKGPDVPLTEDGEPSLRTLWGYLAWKLAGEEGLALVREAEEARTNPGSERLVRVLERAAPCLVLLDELVAYARQLPEERLEAFLSFVQSLTEAAKMVPRAMVVGSLPESDAEAGGERGRQALRRLETVFGRVQSPWLPASGDETYEIVRRRLFQPLDSEGERAREATIKAFHELYKRSPSDFPEHAREPRYLEVMRLCYPLHPELFDRLAKDWGGLEKFQRTRGVLRFLASAIGVLWHQRPPDPLITPARLELAHERIRAAVLHPLEPGFAAVLDAEVDGERSLPRELERNPVKRIARARAATRVARAIFFATAPRVGAAHPGIGLSELRLACAEPGDQLAVFAEAASELAQRASYLYEDAGTFWFSTRPTLNKLAEQRARALKEQEVDEAIVALLQEESRHRGGFHKVFAAPDDPSAIDEAEAASLVILGPSAPHAGRTPIASKAVEAVTAALERCRAAQRRWRNTLLFLAADAGELDRVREAVRRKLAWEGIVADEQLRKELTQGQLADAKERANAAADGALKALRAAWTHLLYPIRDEDTEPGRAFRLEWLRVQVRDQALPAAVWDKVIRDGVVKQKLGKENLRTILASYWGPERPHLELRELVDWFRSYAYLPKLRDRVVLEAALREAAADLDPPFGWAEAVEADGAYRGLRLAKPLPEPLAETLLLVRPEVARARLPENNETTPTGTEVSGGSDPSGTRTEAKPPPGSSKPTRFYGSVELDPMRPIRHIEQILENVVRELQRTPGARVVLTLEVQAEAPQGFAEADVAVVRDNAKALRFRSESTGFST